MARTLLDAIRQGVWNGESATQPSVETAPTQALPGSPEKVLVLAERQRQGAPLWHPEDRLTYGEDAED